MKRIALVFVIAILIPAVLLAVLAVRSLKGQEMVAANQRALLHQSTCEAMVANINLFMDDVRIFFGRELDQLVSEQGADLISSFDDVITENWSQVSVGAVVSDDGLICSPLAQTSNAWAAPFLQNHSDFLSNRGVVEVYQAPNLLYGQLQIEEEPAKKSQPLSTLEGLLSRKRPADQSEKVEKALPAEQSEAAKEMAVAAPEAVPTEMEVIQAKRKVAASSDKLNTFRFENSIAQNQRSSSAPEQQDAFAADAPSAPALVDALSNQQEIRNVEPRSQSPLPLSIGAPVPEVGSASQEPFVLGYNFSQLNRAAVTQNDLTEGESEGAVSRIIDDDLHILLWERHPDLPGYTFWVELNQEEIKSELGGLFEDRAAGEADPEVSLALLGSQGELVAQTVSGFSADWATPFVAAEVGQILPRWEVAAYLLDPEALSESARTALITLSLVIVTLVGAVAVGSLLILKSVNYEMQLAERKTDFVSNVSHELKTPLTSIRMFSELLESADGSDPDQTRKYSGVISKESARLSRLINRLLDFSRLDRGEMKLSREAVDLSELVKETVDNYRLQIEAEGLDVEVDVVPEGPVATMGDRDALSQVLLNLLSNAEKYAANGGEVRVVLREPENGMVEFVVQDRGPGISKLHQRRMFEKFYRADESVSSGIEGSGIGLALCYQIVEKHGGQIRYAKREGGGSSFVVELPITKNHEEQ